MSYVFEIDDVTVWSPALRVGQVFQGYVKVLEAALHVPSGVDEWASDFLVLDRTKFTAFTEELEQWTLGGHSVVRDLAGPVLAICLVMLERAGRPVDPELAQQLDLPRVGAGMPT